MKSARNDRIGKRADLMARERIRDEARHFNLGSGLSGVGGWYFLLNHLLTTILQSGRSRWWYYPLKPCFDNDTLIWVAGGSDDDTSLKGSISHLIMFYPIYEFWRELVIVRSNDFLSQIRINANVMVLIEVSGWPSANSCGFGKIEDGPAPSMSTRNYFN